MISKIIKEISTWRKKIEDLSAIVGRDVSNTRPVILEQLREYKDIARRNNKPETRDERLAKRILSDEIKVLEKQAYPNSIERNIRKGIEVVERIVDRLTKPRPYKPENIATGNISKETDTLIRASELNHKKEKQQKPEKSENHDLNKSTGQYQKNPGKPATDDGDLLQKNRQSNGKGLKM